MLSAVLGAVAPVCSERLRRDFFRSFLSFFFSLPSLHSPPLRRLFIPEASEGGLTVPVIVLRDGGV